MRFVLAFALLAIGIVGIILPVLPGIPFLLAFLYVVGFLKKERFLRMLKRYQGERNSFQRKVTSCILIYVVYHRRLNLK
ncbi:hypothetical protein BCF55_0935 [Hydrogenivirga caldilitoris]|uniref:Uncharacterized protein n=1 Tax=Hydrogenivirga caldilitoris TaxID=246264 RepID=A0A497XNX9_9AQUI|nr:hypothetical protein [Hydrogenivirga caldilitoris]RLJ70655.1 hypothetical protein BCF55_0935 [Hydrogenivirga caldilitoris]